MQTIIEGLKQAIVLILALDPELIQITLLSLRVSLTALMIAGILGIPFGSVLALKEFPGRRGVLNIIYTLMGLPPVLAGLLVYLLLTSQGPFGQYQLLFTPTAMTIAQIVLAFPIVTGLTVRSVQSQRQEVYDTAVTLGASRRQAAWAIIKESRIGIIGALTTALGRVIAEVGAVMMVGGNIQGFTRVMTTSIVLETRMGNDARAIAIGLILLVIAFLLIMIINLIEKRSFQYATSIQIT
ncbi:MAG: ABC transporter permease [Syntrophomonadaceae bacterium]